MLTIRRRSVDERAERSALPAIVDFEIRSFKILGEVSSPVQTSDAVRGSLDFAVEAFAPDTGQRAPLEESRHSTHQPQAAAMRRTLEGPAGEAPEHCESTVQDAERSADSGERLPTDSGMRSRVFSQCRLDLTALALAARKGEPQAVRAFFTAAAPTVRGVCRSVLGANHVELDDTIQECLIEISRALPNYRAEGSAVNYAKQIALHCAVAARKRGRSRERRLRTFAEEHSAHSLAVHVESMPSLSLVRDVIDELPAVQAEAILMRTILGFSLEEIALAMQVSINTAKSRLRVAKQNLRRQLDQKVSSAEGEE